LLVVLIAAGGAYWAYNSNKPVAETKNPTVYIWDIQDSDINRVQIDLPRVNKSQSYVKIPDGDQFPWHFDDAQQTPVDSERWGGGIPLILSGPSANRVIAQAATQEQLAEYGLLEPSMVITLGLADESTMVIEVGNNTPNGENFYVRAPNTDGVAIVDYTWYYVISRLVTEPPYITPTATPTPAATGSATTTASTAIH